MTKSMKDRVAALLRKASDAAASEAEVEKCTQMAMNLMAKYGLSMADVEGDDAEEIGQSETQWQGGRTGDAMIYVQNAIAAFTSTRVSYVGSAARGGRMQYYGYSAERELAVWLHRHICNTIATQSRLYSPSVSGAAPRAKQRRSFAVHMAARISERLFELAATLDDAGRGDGTEVMIVKNAKLDEHFDQLGLAEAKTRARTFEIEGARAGRSAGDDVALHRPVEEQSQKLTIEHQGANR